MSITGVLPEEYGMGQENRPTIEIRKLQGICEAEICARMMTDSEPWAVLGQTYDTSLEIVTDPSREVYLAFIEGEITRVCDSPPAGSFQWLYSGGLRWTAMEEQRHRKPVDRFC